MSRLIHAITNYFTAVPAAISIRNFRYYLVGHMAYHFAVTVHAFWAVLFLVLDVPALFIFNLFSVGIFIFCISANRRGYHMVPTVLAMCEIVAHQVLACLLLGPGSGFQLYLLVVSLYPFIMPDWSRWIKMAIFAMPLAGFLCIEVLLKSEAAVTPVSATWLSVLNITNVFFSFVCLGILGNYLSFAVYKTEEKFDAEFEKSEHLLLNILPRTIAARLKESEAVISDRMAGASILFADLVGFTRFAETMPPDKLVEILNDYFSAFDDLVEKHGLEKIKTIGDAYMVASGVPEENLDHARCIGEFALEMQAAIQACNLRSGHAMQIRIGIHCGPVAAGVIGTKKFAYDLWGDTVNVASRMESMGLPGRIQTTGEFVRDCREHFLFEERGEVDVKGKGSMRTYFLMGKSVTGA